MNWKEFSGRNREEREGERQLLIESEFEETQKKGEEKERKLPWKSEGGCANSIERGGMGDN